MSYIKELKRDLELAYNYIATYGQYDGTCIGCGELKHRRFVCAHCGCDDSDEESFAWWIECELERTRKRGLN